MFPPLPCGGEMAAAPAVFVKNRCLFVSKAMSVILRNCKAVTPFLPSQCLFWCTPARSATLYPHKNAGWL